MLQPSQILLCKLILLYYYIYHFAHNGHTGMLRASITILLILKQHVISKKDEDMLQSCCHICKKFST